MLIQNIHSIVLFKSDFFNTVSNDIGKPSRKIKEYNIYYRFLSENICLGITLLNSK